MSLYRVTLTGADNSIEPSSLFDLAERFPFLEFGILVSQSQQGSTRFPDMEWLESLRDLTVRKRKFLNISAHICGRFLRSLLMGEDDVWQMYPKPLLSLAQRIQLNFHGEKQKVKWDIFLDALRTHSRNRQVEWIFQLENQNDLLLHWAVFNGINAVGLFDSSHGAGKLPSEWPTPKFTASRYGYAGGLGPDNVKTEIPYILAHAASADPTADIWIDMETKLFCSDGNKYMFDLSRCEEVANKCADFIGR